MVLKYTLYNIYLQLYYDKPNTTDYKMIIM